jgi:general secretion pathway protein D
MKKSAFVRFSLTFLMVFSLLSPTVILAAGDGKKHFKIGMKFEDTEEWDKAAEEFALAITSDPKNPEYRLHYQRSLFNASQMYMKRAVALANEKDYAGAYIAFRKAYSFDPVNELAKSEMDRMLRLQQALQNGDNQDPKKDANGKVSLVQTGYSRKGQQDVQVPQRLEKLRDVPFPGGVDLQFIIKELAKDLDLNVLFEGESFRGPTDKKIKIELKNVTAAKALDYIFLQEGLFFQKVGPRTIIVAQQTRRQNFQQLILRTFYLANASPKDVAKVVQTAIPAQPGRTPTIVLTDDATNSITIRDTEENIRLMSKLIKSLDKDRAEVVMDVAIYEVNKQDLLKLGNQVGDSSSLVQLGGSNRGLIGLGGNNNYGGSGADYISRALGAAIAIPSINLVAFQNKQNSKLVASTQIHAFNNEDSSARIGQRVPVRTATFQTGGNVNNSGVVSDVINYEQVGLTLKFKPIVFPNQDVQVAMEIESKDVVNPESLTPIFTERTIKGTARVQNNKTLLLASVAQNVQGTSRQGIPLLGLIPILGRLFTAPSKDSKQVDIVIAVTPKVIRAPAILPEDEEERQTGSLAVPTSGSLEAMIIQDEMDELLAAARRVPNSTQVQLPDQKPEAPVYVRAEASQNAGATASMEKPAGEQPPTAPPPVSESAGASLKPIDSSVKTIDLGKTADTSPITPGPREASLKVPEETVSEPAVKSDAPVAALQIAPLPAAMKAGEKIKLAISVNSATAFRSAVLGFRFDEKKLAVRSVSFGDVFGAGVANTTISPFLNQNGKLFVSLSSAKESVESASGVLAYIEIEALADGVPEMTFEKDVLNFLTPDGRNFVVRY